MDASVQRGFFFVCKKVFLGIYARSGKFYARPEGFMLGLRDLCSP